MAPNVFLVPLEPHNPYRHNGIRKVYIQQLIDLFSILLLRGDIQRAKKAWAILVGTGVSQREILADEYTR